MQLTITASMERATALEQLQAVRTRMLRHDVRNAFNVVEMNASMLADRVAGTNGKRVATVREHVDRLETACDVARDADETTEATLVREIRDELEDLRRPLNVLLAELDGADAICARRALKAVNKLTSTFDLMIAGREYLRTGQSPVGFDPCEVVREFVAAREETFADISVTVDCPEQARARTIPAVKLVIEALLENAAVHTEGETARMTVTVTQEADAIEVTIRDNGQGIPDLDLTVLETGEETPLEHCDGVGLWFVQWVVATTNVTATVDTAAGTVVTLRLPRAE